MHDPNWDVELIFDQTDVEFEWRAKLALGVVIFSLVFVIAGAVFTFFGVFSDTESGIWAFSALLLVGCATYGVCRLLPSEPPTESTDQVATTTAPDDVLGHGTTLLRHSADLRFNQVRPSCGSGDQL